MNFDDIRSYTDSEVPQVLERMSTDKQFINVLSTMYPLLPKDVVRQQLLSVKTVDDFQRRLVYPYLKDMEANRTKGVTLEGADTIDKTKSYLYISNHRDITVDAVFLCLVMIENDMDTVNIGIGDNLLIYPWINDFIRLDKCFVVKRGLAVRKALEASQHLSAYMRSLIKEERGSIWIAQREGRCKDSNDRTQEGLLRMLTLSGEKDFCNSFADLNICPLTISYEYDPTDYLKAKEFQQKRDNPDFKKQPQDDLLSMQVGILGYRGKVVYRISGEITDKLKDIEAETDNLKERLGLLAQVIDKRIHSNYSIFNVNRIAYDLLKKEQRFASEYSDEERSNFEQYISKQIAKVDLEEKDSAFLRIKMLEMYANPLINHLEAIS